MSAPGAFSPAQSHPGSLRSVSTRARPRASAIRSSSLPRSRASRRSSNHFGIRLTAKLTDFSGYLIFAATIVLTLACFAFAEHWDFTRLWTFDNFSGDPTLNAANELKGDPVWPR